MRTIIGVMIAAVVLCGCGARQANQPTGDDPGTLKILTDNVERAVAEKQTAKLEYTTESDGQTIRGAGEIRFGANAAMSVSSVDQDGSQRSVLLVDGAFYLKDGTDSDASIPWFKLDTTRDDPAGKSAAAAVNQLKSMSEPSQFLKQMLGAGTLRGTERTGESTRYTVTIDVTKLASVPGYEDTAPELSKAGADEFTMEIWTGPGYLLNQISTQLTCTKSDTSCVVKQDTYFSDWGTPVTIAAPPADQVREYPR